MSARMSKIRATLLEILGQRGPMSIDDLARAAGRSKMALRYHLSSLAREGLVVFLPGQPSGEVGRPRAMVALAEQAYEGLPKQYDRLVLGLLDEMTALLGTDQTRAILRRLGQRKAGSARLLRRRPGNRPRLQSAVKYLAEQGYLPRWERAAGQLTLHIGNCPYRQVAQVHPDVCEVDLALLQALLGGAGIERRASPRSGGCDLVIDYQPELKAK
jgi:predicted ArsR family transcriptional regulator